MRQRARNDGLVDCYRYSPKKWRRKIAGSNLTGSKLRDKPSDMCADKNAVTGQQLARGMAIMSPNRSGQSFFPLDCSVNWSLFMGWTAELQVFRGTSNAGPPLDVWSLGVILFALLCGRLPFEGSDLEVRGRSNSTS